MDRSTSSSTSSLNHWETQDVNEIEKEDLLWLENNIEPFEIVKEKWELTFEARKVLFDQSKSLNEYVGKFPILKTNAAQELVSFFLLHKNNLL